VGVAKGLRPDKRGWGWGWGLWMGVGLVLHKVRVQGTRVKRLCSAKHNGISRVGNINGQSNAKHIRNPKGVEWGEKILRTLWHLLDFNGQGKLEKGFTA